MILDILAFLGIVLKTLFFIFVFFPSGIDVLCDGQVSDAAID